MPFIKKAQPDKDQKLTQEEDQVEKEVLGQKPPDTEAKKGEEPEDESKLGSLMMSALGLSAEKAKERTDKASEKAKDDGKKKSKDQTQKEQAPKDEPAKEEGKKKKVEVVREEPEEPDDERMARIATSAATSTAEAMMAKLSKQKDEPEVESSDDGMTDDDRSDYEVYKRLAEDNPRYKNAAKDFADGVKKARAYEAKWRENNPDKEFDPEDDEHNDFYERIEPDVTERDFRRAEVAIEADRIAEKRIRERLEPVEKRQREREAAETVSSLRPQIEQSAGDILTSMLETISPDEGEKLRKNPESVLEIVKELEESDPIAFDIMKNSTGECVEVVSEVVKLWRSNGAVPFNQSNPIHEHIRKFSAHAEGEIKKLPTHQRLHQGKRFATWAEAEKMDAATRAKHWVLDDTHIIAMLKDHYMKASKAEYQAQRERLDRYISKKTQVTTEKEEAKPRQDRQAPPDRRAAPARSPESGGGSSIDTTGKGKDLKDEPLTETTRNILFRR